jgi:hypothetical protein
MIYFLRRLTANFMRLHPDIGFNGLPINCAGAAEGKDFDAYLEENVLQMQEDA